MRAVVFAVGSEFLTQNKVETNSYYICQKLLEVGILPDTKIIVNDDKENLVWILKKALKKAQLLVITGGLGPTEDDLTRESVAEVLKKQLVYNEDIEQQIKERFNDFRRKMSENNKRQAFVIEGAEVLPNKNGTAPGQFIENELGKILLLPGPPSEMKPIFDRVLKEKIEPVCKFTIHHRILKFADISESEADNRIADLYAPKKFIHTTILSKPGFIEVKLAGRAKKDIDQMIEETDRLALKIKSELQDFFVTDQDISFEEFVVQKLIEKNITLSVAESCTGGGLGKSITNVAGSSKIFKGGVIAYANEVKQNLLSVEADTLKKFGAVSKECAAEMAKGVMELCQTDIGISVTGIAGPNGGEIYKPVGLVFLYLYSKDGELIHYKVFPGERRSVRQRTINAALNLIFTYLKNKE